MAPAEDSADIWEDPPQAGVAAVTLAELDVSSMRVHTVLLFDIESGILEFEQGFDWNGPVARLDRALTNQATQAAQTAQQQAAGYGGAAGQIQAGLIPQLTSMATTPPGFGTDLGAMETAAMGSAAAASGASAEQSALRAMRTGNVAGLGAEQVGAAGAAARVGGNALQNILAKNAELKASQQQAALGGLERLTGEDIHGQAAMAGLIPRDIEAGIQAQSHGWLQNLPTIMGLAGNVAGGIAGLLPSGTASGGAGSSPVSGMSLDQYNQMLTDLMGR